MSLPSELEHLIRTTLQDSASELPKGQTFWVKAADPLCLPGPGGCLESLGSEALFEGVQRVLCNWTSMSEPFKAFEGSSERSCTTGGMVGRGAQKRGTATRASLLAQK